MVQLLLETLGFTSKEVEVYLTVLQRGKISATDVAKITGINRTTVYSVAKELIKRGVIREDLGKTNRYLVALPPSELTTLMDQEEKRLQQKRKMVENAIQQLEALTKNVRYSIPKISFIEEEELERYLHKRNEEWASSIMDQDGIWWGFQDHTFVEHYQEWVDWSWQQPFQGKMRLQLLTNQSGIEQAMQKRKYERRHMKFWKNDGLFTATLWVNGDYLVLIVTNTRPHSLVEIHDRTLSSNVRTIFKALWNVTN